MSRRSVAVLGGGVSGVVAAAEIARLKEFDVDLIEKAPQLGGVQRSHLVEGLVFDIGAFFFWREHALLRIFPFLRDLLVQVKPRRLRITPQGRRDRYPPSIGGYVRDYGWLGLLRGIGDLGYSRARYRRRDSVPAYAKYYLGSTFYRNTGLQHYIERLYGMPDYEVGLEFAEQRLRRMRSLLWDRGLWPRLLRSTDATTLDLVRPPEGFGRLYEEVHRYLGTVGVSVRLGCSVEAIRHGSRGFDLDMEGRTRHYDRILSTIPIPITLRLLGATPLGRFLHMSLVSLFYRGRLRDDAAVIRNFTWEGSWKRLTAYSRFYGLRNGLDYLTVEVTTPAGAEAPFETADSEFQAQAARLDLFLEAPELVGAVVTPYAYPVLVRGDAAAVQLDRATAQQFGIDLVGRQGNFEYLSSNAAASKALAAARALKQVDVK